MYSMNVPPSFPIQVDEPARTATVQAGVPQRILLDYLAAFKCAPAGMAGPVQGAWVADTEAVCRLMQHIIPCIAGNEHLNGKGTGVVTISHELGHRLSTALHLVTPVQCGRWGALPQDRQGAPGLHPARLPLVHRPDRGRRRRDRHARLLAAVRLALLPGAATRSPLLPVHEVWTWGSAL